MAPLPPREMRHSFLRHQGLEYTNADIIDFEERLERIHDRDTHRDPLVRERVLEFLSMLRFREVLLDLDAPGTIQFQLGLVAMGLERQHDAATGAAEDALVVNEGNQAVSVPQQPLPPPPAAGRIMP
uniref:Uncharacterized protein n=1 Tax=Tanacetum cinerariifolium TaxID=118510 RepID=A0A6L2KDD7_TANCI|nr:hypothetical protein [Tanacetum cinerariifolium]